MKSHQFFSSPTSTPITIYPYDIKQCLDEYAKTKKPSRLHPTSEFIKQFQQFFDALKSGGPLANEQLQWVAKQLKNLRFKKESSDKTYHACEMLYTKMGVLVDYADAYPQVFNQIVSCPKLVGYIQTIERRIPGISIVPIIINKPDALEYLANCQSLTSDMLNLNYLENIKDYQYFPSVMNAIRRLQLENKIIYNNLKEEKTNQVKDQKVWDTWRGIYVAHTNRATSSVFHDRSKNLYYKAKLDSQENINFILRHVDHANLIADVLIKLHEGMIGEDYQKQAEMYMAHMMDRNPGIFLQFSEIVLSNSNKVLDSLKRTLTETQFYAIIQQAIVDQSSVCIPGLKS